MKGIVATICALALAGCSVTLPVQGSLESGAETFVGSATGHADGGGEITIRSSLGATCAGTFVYTDARNGKGTFKCADGRTGPFEFVSTGGRGTGTGRLGGKPFTFTFG
jgi:hypothetical protein